MWGNMAVAEEIPGPRSRSDRKTQLQVHRDKGKKMDILQVKLGKGWRGRFFSLLFMRRTCGRNTIIYQQCSRKNNWMPGPMQVKYHHIISTILWKKWMVLNQDQELVVQMGLPQLLGLFCWGPMWHVRSRPLRGHEKIVQVGRVNLPRTLRYPPRNNEAFPWIRPY